jgi:hypothetical protein
VYKRQTLHSIPQFIAQNLIAKLLGQSGALDRAKAGFWKISWYIRPTVVVAWQKGWSAKSAAWKKKKV